MARSVKIQVFSFKRREGGIGRVIGYLLFVIGEEVRCQWSKVKSHWGRGEHRTSKWERKRG
jgi:hypothetical protein